MLLDTYNIQFLCCGDDVASRVGVNFAKVERIIDLSKAMSTVRDSNLRH